LREKGVDNRLSLKERPARMRRVRCPSPSPLRAKGVDKRLSLKGEAGANAPGEGSYQLIRKPRTPMNE
jgi:hypothetical protein